MGYAYGLKYKQYVPDKNGCHANTSQIYMDRNTCMTYMHVIMYIRSRPLSIPVVLKAIYPRQYPCVLYVITEARQAHDITPCRAVLYWPTCVFVVRQVV